MSVDVKDIPVGEVTVPMAPGDILIHVVKETGEVVTMCCSSDGNPMGAEAAQAAVRANVSH